MGSSTDMIEALRRGDFQLDLPEMVLRQDADVGAAEYIGCGHVSQAKDGGLEFMLEVREFHNTSAIGELQAWLALKPGTLIKDVEYFSLKATASDGAIWVAGRLQPNVTWGNGAQPVVRGHITRLLRNREALEVPKLLRLHFFEKAELPTIMGTAQFEAAGANFEITGGENGFVVQAASLSGEPLPAYFDTRIVEALRFLLSASVLYRSIETLDGLELTSFTGGNDRVARMQPIARLNHAYFAQSWSLFVRYLEFVTAAVTGPYWHPVSAYLHNAREASALSIDAWGAGLGVAVEGLAGLIPLLADDQQHLKAMNAAVLEFAKNSGHAEWPVDRLRGTLKAMLNPRPQDRFALLSGQGAINKDYSKAWAQLRNTKVHPKPRSEDYWDMVDNQEEVDEINQVISLMYQLVFHLIGWTGSFTDYGRHGYPAVQYPLAVEKPKA